MRNANHELINSQKRKEYLGKHTYNSQGEKLTLIEYNTARDVKVKFEDGTVVNTSLGLFKRGSIKKPISNRLGITNVNKDGDNMIVIEYNSYADVTIQFLDEYGYTKKTTWQKFTNGSVKNPYHPIKGGAIVGSENDWGKYVVPNKNISRSKEYNAWYNLIVRCVNPDKAGATYKDCQLDSRWLYFWNFLDWVCNEPNYSKWSESWAIDKDILVSGNKIYGPDTCLLVPKHINNLLLDHKNARGMYSIGVTRRKDGLYEAQCSLHTGKQRTIGVYRTEAEASKAYWTKKCEVLRKVALKSYSDGEISFRCFDALIKRSNKKAQELGIKIISEQELIAMATK